MRTLALLLILANILFLVWAQLIDVRASDLERAPRRSEPTPRIVLAKEQSPQAEPEERDAAVNETIQPPSVDPLSPQQPRQPISLASVVPDAGARPCVSVGPFADLASSAQAQAALRTRGMEPRGRLEQGEVWAGYWVSVQNLPTRDAADDAVKMLKQRNINDVYVLPGTTTSSVISLGIFSDYERAKRRADQIRALGLESQINDRKTAGSAYWIDVDLAQPDQTIDMTLFQSESGKIMRLELRSCPQAG
jgi:hypothetical protein